MKHRSRNIVAAVLASCLLAVAGFSGTAAAHGPGFGGGPGDPGRTPKPIPTLKSHAIKTARPDNSNKPVLSCTTTPAPTSAAPTAAATTGTAAALLKGKMPGFAGNWSKFASDIRGRFGAEWKKVYCQIEPLRAAIDKLIVKRTAGLRGLITKVGKSSLGASDQAIVVGELNSLIAGLSALKTQVDGETTLEALQADLKTLNSSTPLYRATTQWANLILSSQKLIASEAGLQTFVDKVTAEVAAAPDGPEKIKAQAYLDDMRASLAEGSAILAPLPAMLLAITPAQLADGSANPTLALVRVKLFHASWNFRLVKWSGFWAEHVVKHVTATPAPTVTPAPTDTPAPTATV